VERTPYRVQFRLEIAAGKPTAHAAIRVTQAGHELRQLRMRMPHTVFSEVPTSGEIVRDGEDVTWDVPARGGEIRYAVRITHARDGGAYDALVSERWAIFRADDAFPPAAITQRAGARGEAELLLDLPSGWRAVTPYRADSDGDLPVRNADERSYSRPIGWIAAGHIGSRKDMIGSTLVTVAAPKGQGVQRVPMLGLLRWVLPLVQAEVDEVPADLAIIAADDPMWRGGLSAPNSIFIHARRPLISENGTSTLVHELLHVMLPVPAASQHDWIDEGLAEYLGLVLLERSGTISRDRFDHAIATFRSRGARVRDMQTRDANGEVTARAVAILHDLDRELQQRTAGRSDLFELVRTLMSERRPVDLSRLRLLAGKLAGTKVLKSLSAIPGETK
jgi:hypothetical protein